MKNEKKNLRDRYKEQGNRREKEWRKKKIRNIQDDKIMDKKREKNEK